MEISIHIHTLLLLAGLQTISVICCSYTVWCMFQTAKALRVIAGRC